MKRFALCMLAAVSLAAASAGPAQADSTIAAAAMITPGTQHFGNTLCPDVPGDPCPDHEYWKLNLLAGDRVAIDWQVTGADTYACCLSVLPADTTDFSINNVSALRYFVLGSNGKAQSIFTAPRSGMYPLLFEALGLTAGGPYDFVARVEHAARLRIASPTAGRRISRRAKVTVNVRTPNGVAIDDPALVVTVRGTWAGRSRIVGRAPTAGGVARIGLKLPRSARGQSLTLRASVAGPGYRRASSSAVRVRVKSR